MERITENEIKAAAAALGCEIPDLPHSRLLLCPHPSKSYDAEPDLLEQVKRGAVSFGPDDEPPARPKRETSVELLLGLNQGGRVGIDLGAHDVFPSGKGSGGRGKRVLDGLTAKDMKGTG